MHTYKNALNTALINSKLLNAMSAVTQIIITINMKRFFNIAYKIGTLHCVLFLF